MRQIHRRVVGTPPQAVDKDVLELRHSVLLAGHPGRSVHSKNDLTAGAVHVTLRDNGRLIGAVVVTPVPNATCGFEALCRQEAERGNRISWVLMREVCAIALANGCEDLVAYARESNLALYRDAFGFTVHSALSTLPNDMHIPLWMVRLTGSERIAELQDALSQDNNLGLV